MATTYIRPDATLPAIAENGGRAEMSPGEIGQGWSTTSQTRPPAARFNTKDFLTSSAVKYLCRVGVAEYSSDEQYQGLGMCIGRDGSVYWNLQPSQGIDPVGDQSGHWEKMPCRVHDAQELIAALIAGLVGNFLTEETANQFYMRLGSAPTWAEADARYMQIVNGATMQWVLDQLANYATNGNAQAWANNAENNSNNRSDGLVANEANRTNGLVESTRANLQAQIDALRTTGDISHNNVTGQRFWNNTYQNNDPQGRTMEVSGWGTTGGGSTGLLYVYFGLPTDGGANREKFRTQFTATMNGWAAGFNFIVPRGCFYRITVSGTLQGTPQQWTETLW